MREHLKTYIDESKTAAVRGLRILLEYFYATEIFEPIVRDKIRIISVFGSARASEGTPEYAQAYRLGKALCKQGYAVVTGASCGIMQAANQGVADELAETLVKTRKAKSVAEARVSAAYQKWLAKYSVGLKISLPFEPTNNPYVGVNATFHYFMVRKFFFATLSSAFIACEGGWGTRDELYEMLTLVQTGKAPLMPIIYVSRDPGHLLQDLRHTVKKGYIHREDLRLIEVVKTEEEAVKRVKAFYKRVDRIEYRRDNAVRLNLSKPLSAAHKRVIASACSALEPHVGPCKIGDRRVDFPDFPHTSYGYLRQVVDAING